MIFDIKHQQNYSRLELLARTFFGPLYIGIPHGFIMFFLSIGVFFCHFALFFIILFTGKYPRGIWNYLINFQKYRIRVSSTMINLCDGYPEFGLSGNHPNIEFNVAFKQETSRLRMLLRWFLGWIMLIPHLIILFLRFIIIPFIIVIAWFTVLFVGKYPKGLFNFIVGTWRLNQRIYCWYFLFTDNYPAFTGKILETENI